MQGLGQQVLLKVLVDLPSVLHVPVTLVEPAWEEQKATEAIAILVESLLAFELVGVAFVLVRPDVLHFERVLDPARHVGCKTRRHAALALYMMSDPSQQVVHPPPVLLVHIE